MAAPKLPVISFADDTGYDSDEFDGGSSSNASGQSTGVILGFDDGELQAEAAPAEQGQSNSTSQPSQDEGNITVSRIGGRAVFSLQEAQLPPAGLSKCPKCDSQLALLVQIYAPLQANQAKPLSPPLANNLYRDEFDRLLYVFGCIKKGCTGMRCLRSARRNATWAKLGREQRKKAAQEAAKAKEKAAQNPFASSGKDDLSNPFSSNAQSMDFGSLFFGSTSTEDTTEEKSEGLQTNEQDTALPASGDTSEASCVWSASAVAIPPRYLTTDVELLSSNTNSKQAQLAKRMDNMALQADSAPEPSSPHKGGRTSKTKASTSSSKEASAGSEGWSAEAYEIMRISGVEEVFLAFQERLEASNASEQIVRYEFGGVPLPYSANSQPYKQLWKATPAAGSSTAITRASHAPQSQQPGFRRYDSRCSSIQDCPHCGSQRTFELQLMPNLVTIAEKALQGANGELGWATAWCFTCAADCLDKRSETEDRDLTPETDDADLDWQGWREEVVLVELED